MFSIVNSSVFAQQNNVRLFKEIPTVDEIVVGLTPKQPPLPAGRRTRGAVPDLPDSEPEPSVVALPTVKFEFDDYTLTPTAKKTLNVVAQALNRPDLRPYRFLIEGHTDSVGQSAYNKALSVHRAESAKHYLVQLGVEQRRLIAVGKGEDELYDVDNPESAYNRRVEIETLQ